MRSLLIMLAIAPLPVLATGQLNDTGILYCGDYPAGNVAAPCVATPTGQDSQYGRDAVAAAGTLAKTGGGEAGFDFTKIANDGRVLPATAPLGPGPGDWACTRDNVTGLIWEIKTDDGGPRDKDNRYTNYDDVTKVQKWDGAAYVMPTQEDIDAPTNSIGFVNAVNAVGLCGASDWRRPSGKELFSVVHLGRLAPPVDPTYFPNTTDREFWSGTPWVGNSILAWSVQFGNEGETWAQFRRDLASLRLVRGNP